jgi:flagellar FliJ protein
VKFEFTFEKLLGHKRTLEDVARREWSEAKAKVDAAMKILEEMYQLIDSSRLRAGEISSEGGAQTVALSQIDTFISGQKIRIERHRATLRELLGELERRQELLVEAAKERKTLEKLKERRLEEYKLARKKRELKRMDELVVTRFKRGSDV